MQIITITGTGAAQPILTKGVQPANSLYFQTLLIQYAGTGTAYLGDAAVSSTNGLSFISTQQPVVIPLALQHSEDLYTWFCLVPSGQKLTIMLIP